MLVKLIRFHKEHWSEMTPKLYRVFIKTISESFLTSLISKKFCSLGPSLFKILEDSNCNFGIEKLMIEFSKDLILQKLIGDNNL